MQRNYDDEIWEQVPERLHPPPRHLVEFVRGVDRVERALDLGCGDGSLTGELRAARVTGADPSSVALARARRRLPEARLVELEADGPLPFGDGDFDLVLCAETLEHVRDVQRLLSEARRVLRPGGAIAITTPAHGRLSGARILLRGFERYFDPLSPHLRFFTRRSLTRLLGEMGFEVAAVRRRQSTLLVTARR